MRVSGRTAGLCPKAFRRKFGLSCLLCTQCLSLHFYSNAFFSYSSHNFLDVLRRTSDAQNRVILSAATYEYIELFENLVCNLAEVGGKEHLVLVALDADVFTWAQNMHIEVVYDKHISRERSLDPSQEVRYGKSKYNDGTKLKSRATLQVLKAGYSVIFTDPDVVWFVNPLDMVKEYETKPFMIQTDSRNSTSLLGNLNSGLYFVQPVEAVVRAFEQIVEEGKTARSSEQPIFNNVLCQQHTERGCFFHTSEISGRQDFLETLPLPVFSFPNGGIKVKGKTFFEQGVQSFVDATGEPLYAVHSLTTGLSASLKRLSDNKLSGCGGRDQRVARRAQLDTKHNIVNERMILVS